MRVFNALYAAVVTVCAFGLFWGAYAYFKAEELDAARARLSLYHSTVGAELQNFAHLPFVLSLDPVVAQTLVDRDNTRLNERLARFAEAAGVDAIYLMDLSGLTIAASNALSVNSFLGQNYQFRPYFQAALDGQLGEFYGIGATSGIPGYFFALAVRPEGGPVGGVIAIKVDLSKLQENWQASGERILLSNSDGVVLLASSPDWRYRALEPLSEDQQMRIVATRQFGREPLETLDWTVNLPRQTAVIGGQRFLYLSSDDLPNGWTLHFFAPDDPAVLRASVLTGGMILLSGLLFLAFQLRRVRQMRAALVQSTQEEAQLRVANDRLAIEIEERRAAERSLQKTQAELEQAGRLAALGQLASSVTHELGQPIAAMRNQLTAAEMTVGRSPLHDKMLGLVMRMENITKQLKFFSRKGQDRFEPFDLAAAMTDALDLITPRLAETEATLRFDPPEADLMILGNKLRIEQVMTNLVRNALDAVEETDLQEVAITMGSDESAIWFEVADSGHGLGDRTIEDLREPFTTTRESGKGMGLGLTISAGIVSDHGGRITARNRECGGAVFRVVLPRARGSAAP
ncbi:MAG: ATP-binding protein [Pseudomonadota bacterium]